jgi:hypothetical protein
MVEGEPTVSNLRRSMLILAWLQCYNSCTGRSFEVAEWPDLVVRDAKSIDAVAREPSGLTLGIEHTLLQPFLGETEDVPRFMTVLGRLNKRSDIAVRDWHDHLSIRVGAVPTGVNWEAAGAVVEAWYASTAPRFNSGVSVHEIPDVGFELAIKVVRNRVPGPGRVYAARQMPNESVHEIVRLALRDKLPKLAAASTDVRILLFEQNVPARGSQEVGEAIDDLRSDFPDLAAINEVWCACTVAWQTERFRSFLVVWPLGNAKDGDLSCAAREA